MGFILGEKVSILNGDNVPDGTGRVVGMGCHTLYPETRLIPHVVVRLDTGFWDEKRQTFLTHILVHPDNLVMAT